MADDVVVHYVAADPVGPIRQERRVVSQKVGSSRQEQVLCSGNRLRVPCQPARTCLNRGVGKGRSFRLLEFFPATAQLFHEVQDPRTGEVRRLELVTCPKCKASALYRRDVAAYEAGLPQTA